MTPNNVAHPDAQPARCLFSPHRVRAGGHERSVAYWQNGQYG